MEKEMKDFVKRNNMAGIEIIDLLEIKQLAENRRKARFCNLPPKVHFETLGLAAAERFAEGIPVFTSNNSSMPKVVGDKGTLVDSQDVGGWSRIMEQVVIRPELPSQSSISGLDRARQFNWEKWHNKPWLSIRT